MLSSQRKRLFDTLLALLVMAGVAVVLHLPRYLNGEPLPMPNPALASAAQSQQNLSSFLLLNQFGLAEQLPSWDPYANSGQPFLAQWSTRCLSPFTLPFYFFPFAMACLISFLLKTFIAGLTAFYVGRKFGLAPLLALTGGVLMQTALVFQATPMGPASDALPWFPLLILYAERLSLGQPGYWPSAGVTLALVLLGGGPTVGIVIVIPLILFLAIRAIMNRKIVHPFSAFLSILGAALAALFLVAPQLVAYAEWVSLSDPADASMPPFMSILETLQAVLFGIPLHQSDAASPVTPLYPTGLAALGGVLLWLSLRSSVIVSHRQRVDALLYVILLLPLAAAAILLTPLAQYWPPGVATNVITAPMLPLLGLLLAATGQEWVDLNADQCKRAIARLLLYVPASMTILAVMGYLLSRQEDAPQVETLLLPALPAVAMWCVLLGLTVLRPSARVFGIGIAAILLFETIWLAGRYREDRPIPGTTQESSSFANLLAGATRIAQASPEDLPTLTMRQIGSLITPSHRVLKRHTRFVKALESDPPLLRRAGVSVLALTRPELLHNFAPLREDFILESISPAGSAVFLDPVAQSRAWITHTTQQVPPGNDVIPSSAQPPLVEDTLPTPNLQTATHQPPSITEETPTTLRIVVEQTDPGVLILSDAVYPGWTARIDGDPSPILPVDHLFRGIALPAGGHEIEMDYEPLHLRSSLWVSLITALFLACYSVVSLLFSRKRRRS